MNKGILISAMSSSQGKTLVSCMIAAGLTKRGVAIQGFKAGPDYIDPAYMSHYSNSSSRNLDLWLMGENWVKQEYATHTLERYGLIEGVMGLFDGASSLNNEGSSYELAKTLNLPVILNIACGTVARTMVIAIKGLITEAGEDVIKGIILNRVKSASYSNYLREAFSELNIPILGSIPNIDYGDWSERHLGLQASQETDLASIEQFADLAEKHIDLDGIMKILKTCQPSVTLANKNPIDAKPQSKRIAIAKDAAFHFYYKANLDWLEQEGAELVEFSPLEDKQLPESVDGILLGGGFPEVFLKQLSENIEMKSAIKSFIESDHPCYAECGGLMYLIEHLIDRNGRTHDMAGVIPGSITMTPSLQNFGYSSISNINTEHSESYKGHEFHYSKWNEESQYANAWNVTKKRDGTQRKEGYTYKKLLASYVHLYFPQASEQIRRVFDL